MSKQTKFFELERREDGQLVNVVVFGQKGMPTIEIGSQNSIDIQDSQSALRAASDFHRFGLYAHPQTVSNLHIYAKTGTLGELFRATNLGVIGSQYGGDMPFPVPHETEYPLGWAQLNVRNNRFYLTPFNKEYDELRARKHDFVEALVRGYGLKLRVLPFNTNKGEDGLGLADKIVATWIEEDDVKAQAMRIDGFNRAQAKQFMNRPILQALRQNGGVMPAAETPVVSVGQPLNGGIILTTLQGEVIDITKFDHCVLVVHDNRKNKFKVAWDGSYASKSRLAQVAKANWQVELPTTK